MRRFLCLVLTSLACTVSAQDEKVDEKYENPELGIKFDGVYGWETKKAAGSGAWNELASYRNTQRGATVRLMIQNNPWETMDDLRKSLQAEFDVPPYKNAKYKDVAMKKGNQLAGIEVECTSTVVTKEGKKREFLVVSRTYFGVTRLYRIHCVVRFSQARRVRDLLDQALAGLRVDAKDEKVAEGTQCYSVKGKYSFEVPPKFLVMVSPRGKADVWLDNRSRKIQIRVYSLGYDGTLEDAVYDMKEYYKDDITIDADEASVMGGKGFLATIKKGGKVTYVAGTVQKKRVYRVHLIVDEKGAKDAKPVFEKFVASVKPR